MHAVRTLFARTAALCGLFATAAVAATPAAALTLAETKVDGLKVWRYTWTDSAGLQRSVSLKKQGEGNPGNGGYAVQMTYQTVKNGKTRNMVIAPSATGDGFGYFVAHERLRQFNDGSEASIAGKLFREDDSPLGRSLPVTAEVLPTSPTAGAVVFRQNYPKYGTVNVSKVNPNTGQDSPRVGVNPALYKKYTLAVSITWSFADGTDFPRIATVVDMSDIPGPDRVSFDVRGPYGKMDFDIGTNPIKAVMWGDRFLFGTTTAPLTRNSSWNWSRRNAGARFNALVAGKAEMGLVEPVPVKRTATNDGYSEARSQTSATYNGGNGCPFQNQKVPCDYEWAYQSSQYELPPQPAQSTISEKIAWGSTPFYGTSLPSTYDGTASIPFVGFPASKQLAYDICLVYGQTRNGGLTASIAKGGGTYSCAAPAAE